MKLFSVCLPLGLGIGILFITQKNLASEIEARFDFSVSDEGFN